jgi:hypothetical protein
MVEAAKPATTTVRIATEAAAGLFENDPQGGRLTVYARDEEFIFYLSPEALRLLHRQLWRALGEQRPS